MKYSLNKVSNGKNEAVVIGGTLTECMKAMEPGFSISYVRSAKQTFLFTSQVSDTEYVLIKF